MAWQATKTNRGVGSYRRVVGRLLGVVVLAGLGWGVGGCQTMLDYANLQNSFLSPNEVGRFDKDNPFYTREVKPVKWPILKTIDVIDAPDTKWARATDPLPGDLVPEIKEATLGPGDTVQVSVFELQGPGQDTVRQVRINEYGMLNVPGVGSVPAKGLTPTQLEQKIAQVLVDNKIMLPAGPGQPGPQVSVIVLDSRQRLFSVLGAVARPGTYNILSFDFRLLDAVALIGDIPAQPGLDYLYIIRQTPYTEGTTTEPGGPGATGPGTSGGGGGATPADILKDLERGATQPGNGSETAPATDKGPTTTGSGMSPMGGGGSLAPRFVRPLPTAMVVSGGGEGGGLTLAQADLDAALGLPSTTSASAASASQPALPSTGRITGTAASTSAPATQRDQDLLNRAMNGGSATQQATNYVYIDGRWVAVGTQPASTTQPATAVGMGGTGTLPGPETTASGPATTPTTATTATTVAGTTPATTTVGVETTFPATAPEGLTQQRVIKIPLAALREGVSKYNVVIRPGDIINVPAVDPGYFYLMGHISRPGVYTLTGQNITVKQALASAGGLDPLANPKRCDLIRRIGQDQEATVQVHLKAIFDGEEPDLFLKPNDVLNVGTDAIIPFLAVMRNAYRASYGWGFTYDRNLYTGNNNNGT